MSIECRLFCIVFKLRFYFPGYYFPVELTLQKGELGQAVDMSCFWGLGSDKPDVYLEWHRRQLSESFEMKMMDVNVISDEKRPPNIPFSLQKKVSATIKPPQKIALSY